jgi:hypothetical protein
MNKLSQECKEVLEMMEIVFYHPELGYNNVLTTLEPTINEKLRKSFGEGLQIALINPTIYQSAGLMSVEDMTLLIEWATKNGWNLWANARWTKRGYTTAITTAELLTIFRQQINKNDT